MIWECCRPLGLQEAQTLDGSGPMRLGSCMRLMAHFPFPKLQKPGHRRPCTGSRCECRRYWLSNRKVPSIAWMVEVCPCLRTCPLMTLLAIPRYCLTCRIQCCWCVTTGTTSIARRRPVMTFYWYARNALLSMPCHRDSCVEACCGQVYSSPSRCNCNCDDEKECTYVCKDKPTQQSASTATVSRLGEQLLTVTHGLRGWRRRWPPSIPQSVSMEGTSSRMQ